MTTSVAAATLATLAALAVACVDPKGDFDAYVARTEGARGVVPGSGGDEVDASLPPIQGAQPTADIKAPYLLACLPTLSGGDVRKALRFQVQVEYTAGSTLKLVVTPLLSSAATLADVDPKSRSIDVPAVSLGADGRYQASLGTIDVSGDANPITGRDITVENTGLRGVFFENDKWCAQLDGKAIRPLTVDISKTPCITQRFAALTDPLPVYGPEDRRRFACPL